MLHLRYLPLLFLLAFLAGTAAAQSATGTLAGRVSDAQGTAVPGATIRLDGTLQATATDADGRFTLPEVAAGRYTVLASGIGYETSRQAVTVVAGQTMTVNFSLRESAQQLREVTVTGQSEQQQQRTQAIKTDVLDLRPVQSQAATLPELMSRVAGVRVRQTGGLGSGAAVNINGFQGKAVRFFKDGVPLDYYGDGYNLTLLPVNVLSRVDIYKGVLPVRLGADALGGAVDLISKPLRGNTLDVSYEVASFGTHRGALSIGRADSARGLFAGFDGFVNVSRNDYDVTVLATDPVTRTDREVTVPRFHDQFRNYFGEVYGGVRGRRWAEELRLGLSYFRIDKDEQHGALMSTPYGAITSGQYSWVPTLRYRHRLLGGRLEVDQFAVANTLRSERTDTCACAYDWFGNRLPNPNAGRVGEISSIGFNGSEARIALRQLTSRSYLAYQLTPRQRLELNVVAASYHRTGEDPRGPRFFYSQRDILSDPASYTKLVAGLGLESRFGGAEQFTNVLTGKFFRYETSGTDALFFSYEEEARRGQGQRWGVAEALKWQLTPTTLLRASGELATRLPEQSEVFGDGILRISNFELKPERSLNLNLGYRYEAARLEGEVNGFFRRTEDLILEIPNPIPFSRSLNVDQVQGWGVSAEATVRPAAFLAVSANATYQALRLFGIEDEQNRDLDGARLRNTPYLYANLSLLGTLPRVLGAADALRPYYHYGYVHTYFLSDIRRDQEPGLFGGTAGVDTNLLIPAQHLHTAGFTYAPFSQERFTLNAEVKNLLDVRLYDNFRVQRAGRSLHLKLRYAL